MKAPFQVIALVTLGSVALAAAAPADASQVRRFGAVGQGPDPRGVAAQDSSEQRGDPSALRLKAIRLPDGRVLTTAPTSAALAGEPVALADAQLDAVIAGAGQSGGISSGGEFRHGGGTLTVAKEVKGSTSGADWD